MDERTSRKGSIFAKQRSATEDIRHEKKIIFGQEEGLGRPTKELKTTHTFIHLPVSAILFPFVSLPTRHQRKKEKPEDAEEVRSGGL